MEVAERVNVMNNAARTFWLLHLRPNYDRIAK